MHRSCTHLHRSCTQEPRYIDKELEEGKPNSRYIDYQEFPGGPGWLAWFGEQLGEHLASSAQPPQWLATRYSRNFEIVRKSAIGPFLSGTEVDSHGIMVSKDCI